ncbi:DUF1801 domain-containing protein [Mucilaginibacter aquaedulcis]|uniref:DUF1801 domain-containing protein n=1 Tax=Mucilaginibacter aquaedulcis TaxID=1187081 RepID=UPI0025B56754|nr:DUF1801 domain-containing protein [Mucilaginibacter aquaedulcis]MDN3549119.1 DUF1801 domain-containing protein [Mucilaginibacter aquaedulcis]
MDNFYLQKDEPVRGCLLALREIILKQDENISASLKYGMPFFCYKGKMFCYLWVHKKLHQPYIGIVEGKNLEHPMLIIEKRARMKIMLFEADKDLPIETIEDILQQTIKLYKSGIVKVG